MIPTALNGYLYTDFISALVSKRGVSRYLEVGVNSGDLLKRICAETAIGVDPAYRLDCNVAAGKRELYLFQETSDAFFANKIRLSALLPQAVDFAFLDGMHQFEFLLRDFINTEAISGRASVIGMHDCLALDGNMIHRQQGQSNVLTNEAGFHQGWWTGDVWKIIPILRKFRPDLRLIYVDSFPTGVVLVTKLDPQSTVLSDNYLDIVSDFSKAPNDEASLATIYDKTEIISAAEVLKDNTLYLVS